MKLIKPRFKIIPQIETSTGIFKHIERCGRVAYKSEERINENSYTNFVQMIVKKGHLSVLEHGTIYLQVFGSKFKELAGNYAFNPYSKIRINEGIYHITTNYRVLVENSWLSDLTFRCEPTEFHEKRVTVLFTCDRGVSHEFVRHRVMSFTQESTRYCNYSKDKFNNELTFIIPNWFTNESIYNNENIWEASMQLLENNYNFLIKKGWLPQQARSILPNSLKTELVMTGFIDDWKGFFELRTSTAAHPQARELAIPLRQYFINLKYMKDDNCN